MHFNNFVEEGVKIISLERDLDREEGSGLLEITIVYYMGY